MDDMTQNRFENLKGTQHTIPKLGSWIRTFRRFLGMSQKQLAHRLGISSPSLYQLEQNEIERKISLKNLERIANSMDCDLVYFLVPRQEFGKIREKQAEKRAKNFLKNSADETLLQENPIEKEETLHLLVKKLIHSKHLWNEDPSALQDLWHSQVSPIDEQYPPKTSNL